MRALTFVLSLFLFNCVSARNIYGLHVDGNQIKNGDGSVMHFRGIDRSGTEYMCMGGWGIFDGPVDATAIKAILSWNVTIVRVPLNEDCWLNINGAPAQYSGEVYRQAIVEFVNLLNSFELNVILDLHWAGPGTQQATGQIPMPDADHAPDFWSSVANTFKNNSAVIFDLYNEPFLNNNEDTDAGWSCWKNGGTCPGLNYQAAGFQSLINAVRNAGADNIVMLGGMEWSNRLTQWLDYLPTDPKGNIAASWHSYNFNACNNQNCWDSTIAAVAAKYPVITGEMGENDCNSEYVSQLMQWMDQNGISYLAWSWNTADCANDPALISNYDGTPTNYGIGVQKYYLYN